MSTCDKFSSLPESSWEKQLVNLIDKWGGDSPSLCNWSDEVPSSEKLIAEIEDLLHCYESLVQHYKHQTLLNKKGEWWLHYTLSSDPLETKRKKKVTQEYAENFLVDDYPELSFGECVFKPAEKGKHE